MAQAVKNKRICSAGDLIPRLGGSPGEGWQPSLVFLPGECHGQQPGVLLNKDFRLGFFFKAVVHCVWDLSFSLECVHLQ